MEKNNVTISQQHINYQIVLIRDKRLASFNLLAWLIIITNALSLYYFTLNTNRFREISVLLIILTALLLVFFLNKIFKWGWFQTPAVVFGFLLAATCWFLLGLPFPGIANILICFLSVVAARRQVINVSEQSLKLPSFPTRTISWNQLNNLLLKDGIVTIDFKNNKLLQQEIDTRVSRVDEKEFNDFCKAQIAK